MSDLLKDSPPPLLAAPVSDVLKDSSSWSLASSSNANSPSSPPPPEISPSPEAWSSSLWMGDDGGVMVGGDGREACSGMVGCFGGDQLDALLMACQPLLQLREQPSQLGGGQIPDEGHHHQQQQQAFRYKESEENAAHMMLGSNNTVQQLPNPPLGLDYIAPTTTTSVDVDMDMIWTNLPGSTTGSTPETVMSTFDVVGEQNPAHPDIAQMLDLAFLGFDLSSFIFPNNPPTKPLSEASPAIQPSIITSSDSSLHTQDRLFPTTAASPYHRSKIRKKPPTTSVETCPQQTVKGRPRKPKTVVRVGRRGKDGVDDQALLLGSPLSLITTIDGGGPDCGAEEGQKSQEEMRANTLAVAGTGIPRLIMSNVDVLRFLHIHSLQRSGSCDLSQNNTLITLEGVAAVGAMTTGVPTVRVSDRGFLKKTTIPKLYSRKGLARFLRKLEKAGYQGADGRSRGDEGVGATGKNAGSFIHLAKYDYLCHRMVDLFGPLILLKRDHRGKGMIHYAAAMNDRKTILLLSRLILFVGGSLPMGSSALTNINTGNTTTENPTSVTVNQHQQGHLSIRHILRRLGNLRTHHSGLTPLHIAAHIGHSEAVEALLHHCDADPFALLWPCNPIPPFRCVLRLGPIRDVWHVAIEGGEVGVCKALVKGVRRLLEKGKSATNEEVFTATGIKSSDSSLISLPSMSTVNASIAAKSATRVVDDFPVMPNNVGAQLRSLLRGRGFLHRIVGTRSLDDNTCSALLEVFLDVVGGEEVLDVREHPYMHHEELEEGSASMTNNGAGGGGGGGGSCGAASGGVGIFTSGGLNPIVLAVLNKRGVGVLKDLLMHESCYEACTDQRTVQKVIGAIYSRGGLNGNNIGNGIGHHQPKAQLAVHHLYRTGSSGRTGVQGVKEKFKPSATTVLPLSSSKVGEEQGSEGGGDEEEDTITVTIMMAALYETDSRFGRTPLHWACAVNHVEAVRRQKAHARRISCEQIKFIDSKGSKGNVRIAKQCKD
ncbi:hypothetical protein HK102_009656 [Quaeritorhiza haematococci]|nr:hypothetical protein HK102_009656 [Quaeritorhiza haematococci]